MGKNTQNNTKKQKIILTIFCEKELKLHINDCKTLQKITKISFLSDSYALIGEITTEGKRIKGIYGNRCGCIEIGSYLRNRNRE